MTPVREFQRMLFHEVRRRPHQPVGNLTRFVTDWTVLQAAWKRVAAKGKSPGPDGLTVTAVKSQRGGVDGLLRALAEDIQSGKYRPGGVHRFQIPKAHDASKTRTIVILNLRDRLVHMAVKLVLDPIIEARSHDRSFGFRAGPTHRVSNVSSVFTGICDGLVYRK